MIKRGKIKLLIKSHSGHWLDWTDGRLFDNKVEAMKYFDRLSIYSMGGGWAEEHKLVEVESDA